MALSLGIGAEMMLTQSIYVYSEFFLRGMFINSMTLDDVTHSAHEINKPLMPSYIIGVGYSF